MTQTDKTDIFKSNGESDQITKSEDNDMKGKCSMRRMSQLVDVSVIKLKQWCDDGFIVPDRSPLGYFRYNQEHIDFIKSDDFSDKLNEFYNNKKGNNND